MTPHEYALLDVFTDKKFGGNQLAVFRTGQAIPEHALQPIAKELNLPETVFVMPPLVGGDHRLRIFTPAREVPFAGHPTVGAAFFLSGGVDATLRIEEKVGTLQVTVRDGFTEMEQPLPEFRPGPLREQIAPLLSLKSTDIDPSLPIEIGSSGNAFTFVPLNDLDAVKRAAPLGITDAAFLFTRQTLALESTVHGRMFAGWQGVAEDPATGSACGPLGAYLVRHGLADGKRIVVEQGYEMGRPSLIGLAVVIAAGKLVSASVGGDAVIVTEGTIEA
jgi:trans-2,3-dihydro-3-hydroxyanthranilate isomerase